MGCNDNYLEAETLKGDNEVTRVGLLDFTSLKQVPDQSILVDKLGAYGYSNVENLTNGNQNGHELAPCFLPLPQFEMVKKGTEFYMDKAVTEVELPKMFVCYKEGFYHIMKDICVDEGLHSFDSILVHNAVKDEKAFNESKFDIEEFSNKHISDSLKSLKLNGQLISDVNSEVTEHASLWSEPKECGDVSHTTGEIVSHDFQENNFDEMLLPLEESDRCQSQEQIIDIHNENATQCSLASLLEEDSGNANTAKEIIHASETKELLLVQELDREPCHAALLSLESNIEQPQLVNNDIDKPNSINSDSESTAQTFSVYDSSNRGDQVDEGVLEEANSTTSCMSSEKLKEEVEAKHLPDIDYSSGYIVAFDIDSELPATIPQKNCEGTFGLVTNTSMMEDTSSDGPTASSQTSFGHGHADANFLGPVSLSSRIACSGQIPYSGSISLRSDSSTTSIRSFAFPVLQSEWNGSPVRMAKAERRPFRRHRGWRSGLFCCRF